MNIIIGDCCRASLNVRSMQKGMQKHDSFQGSTHELVKWFRNLEQFDINA